MKVRLLPAAARAVAIAMAIVMTSAVVSGCKTTDVELAARDGGGASFADADPQASDAGPNAGCVPGGAECNNCLDDDGDGRVDGFDPHCTSASDDDESSFDTGIPGDNKDAVNQDCFFDGDSGGGNDGCNIHVCCLLDLMGGDCPAEFKPNQYDPNDCEVSAECVANCGPLTPPGCDCFGCCTLCNDDDCFDVITNPAVAPDCDVGVIDDSSRCPRCIKQPTCGTDCDPAGCVLCPGQTVDDLPPQCDLAECPAGISSCTSSAQCLSDEFCSNGCCIRQID